MSVLLAKAGAHIATAAASSSARRASIMHTGFLSCPGAGALLGAPSALNLFHTVHLITVAGAATSAFAVRPGEPLPPRASAHRIGTRKQRKQIIPVYAVLQGRAPGIYAVCMERERTHARAPLSLPAPVRSILHASSRPAAPLAHTFRAAPRPLRTRSLLSTSVLGRVRAAGLRLPRGGLQETRRVTAPAAPSAGGDWLTGLRRPVREQRMRRVGSIPTITTTIPATIFNARSCRSP
jgi:hypothetical protein